MKRFLVLLDCKYSSSSYVFAVGELYDITANSDKEAIDLAKLRTSCKNPKVVKVEELSVSDKIPDLVTNCQVYDGSEWKSYSNGKLVEFSNFSINNFMALRNPVIFDGQTLRIDQQGNDIVFSGSINVSGVNGQNLTPTKVNYLRTAISKVIQDCLESSKGDRYAINFTKSSNFLERVRKCFSNDYVESKLSESSYIIPNPPKEFKVPYAVIIYDLDGKFKNGFLEINDEEENNSDFINNEFKDSINRYLKSGKSDLLVRYYQNQNKASDDYSKLTR